MAQVRPEKPVSGKRLVWGLAIGFLVFSVVMGFGTYYFANWLTPMLERRQKESAAREKAEMAKTQVPQR